MRGLYSVFNPRGEKIADCGIERDAVTLMHGRNKSWDGHYFQYNPLPGVIVDINQSKELEPYIPVKSIADDIVVNMDGGVGGSWKVESVPVLEESDAEVFIPE
jgi:hypothetical protein